MIRWMVTLVVCLAGSVASAGSLKLNQGDHVGYIGGTLADRMQHHGWLEARLQSRFPEHELVFRNLGFSGDEINHRIRSANFGSPDQWLTKIEADVVFAFFGYNESYRGKEGLDDFKNELDAWIKHTLGQKYNGQSAPRLVLFSPIAFENHHSSDLPDGREQNDRLELYTDAMQEVAQANQVLFVDLFRPTLRIFNNAKQPLTINGIHLTEEGNAQLAAVIEQKLFPEGPAIKRNAEQLEKLRQAVLDKNFYWFQRYRTTDGYSIYGGRADLKFVDGQTNREVMQREMEVLDVMTANRDRRIWAVAQGGDLKVDDSNTPPFIPVKTNKPGEGPGGEHIFLGGEEAIEKMTVAQGMEVQLFASEEQFPELVNPVQMAWDTQGRLWVCAWRTYPHWKPKEPMDDKLLILEDTNGDGRADKCTTFAGDLHNPTGFEFWNGGVLVANAPDLLFLKDTDGDDQADVVERVLNGLDSADTHHASNSFVLGPDGAMYFQEGTFHHTQVESPYRSPVRSANAGVFRYEPRTHKFEVFVAFGFANPHGHAIDRWGQGIVHDGTGANPYHTTLFSGHTEFPMKHQRPPQVYQQRTRPCPATEILSSRHFPDEMQGNLLVGNVIGFQGILQYKMKDNGASFGADEVEPIVSSTDPSFRPVDLEIGPDGALYFTDWQNPIIGHMQHNLRDPSRDQKHGRVYRVIYKDRPLLEPVKIASEPVEKLLNLLKEPEDRVRYRARIELSSRNRDEVIAAAEKWIAGLDRNHPDYEHQVLEGLWVYQQQNVVNPQLLERVLASPDFRARAAATRVLCYWRDRVSSSLDLLRRLAADEHPRVRLEAIRAASFYTVPEAIEVVIIAEQQSMDEFLTYTANETKRTLEPFWQAALANKQEIPVTTTAGARFFLRNMSTEQLLSQQRTLAVNLELMFRAGVRDEIRQEALTQIAAAQNKSELRVLLDSLQVLGQDPSAYDQSVVFDLVRLLAARSPAELGEVRGELEKLALESREPVLRQMGFVALVSVDRSTDKAWELANQSTRGLYDLAMAMPMISDPSLRAELYPRVEPLVDGLPEHFAEAGKRGTYGRYVRIELPGDRRTLTLAEVEVESGGRNVARSGRATQKTTGAGGVASRGIDGNTSGSYGAGGQTHTQENIANPWWEVDLGDEMPIERIVIYNRTDGDLGKRLDGFTLQVLDAGRQPVYEQKGQPAPKVKAEWKLNAGGESLVRRAAMNALVSVRGQEGHAFKKLAPFVKAESDRGVAIRAMQRIPRDLWPKEEAAPLLTSLMSYISGLAPQDRTTPVALDALEFADNLAALLPAEEGKQVRAQLRELGVRVIRIGTLPERMAYDKEVIAVRAGRPVEFIFENYDMMPHNLVIVQPGSLEELGLLAESTAQDPDASKRHFVPQSNKVLLGSRLLQPRESERLTFNAPTEPGVYPYVCTYPGHWRRMYGALYVVEDLDAYLADPEGYLTAHSLPIKDELLKDRRPRTEWKMEDLVQALEELHEGRSYGAGKQMFQVASCTGCHKMDGVGQPIGPDLTQMDPKYLPADVLRHLLEPSEKIDEKYQTYNFVLASGKVLSGMILEETDDTVKVIENPLAQAEPVVIQKSEIDEQIKSPVSIMPRGLLDTLSRDEILDLVAYVMARGDQQSKLIKQGTGGHQHHNHQQGHQHKH